MDISLPKDMDTTLPRESFPEIIANKLEKMIIKGDFIANQRLPSEQTLAGDFSVSRPVIREAMKILKERGLVVQKNGGGTFVREPDSELVTDTISRIIHMKNIAADDIFDIRINLETMAAAQAAIRATDKEFDALEKINEHMCINRDNLDIRTQDDVLFHRKIAQMSGNLLLEIFVESMASLVTQMVKYTIYYKIGNQEGIDYHNRIIEVLRSRNVAEAKKIVRQHLEMSQQNYILAMSYKDKEKL